MLSKRRRVAPVHRPKGGRGRGQRRFPIEVQQTIEGGPSVLYDAVALLPAPGAGLILTKQPAARDFIADAFAHAKFIAYAESATPLLEKVVGRDELDAGLIQLKDSKDVVKFVRACRKLRFWQTRWYYARK